MNDTVYRLLAGGETAGGMAPSDVTAPEQFTGADTTELNATFFETPLGKGDGTISTGVWLCAPCRCEIESFPVHEMMTIIEGSVTVTTADGKAETFTAGDSLFIAKGTKCVWEITETLRKFYMIVA
ncbi:cupin domain-containing protein [Pelagibius sp. 7325]|uniref:cupin domain-containing protein n=1 Tax=Pelagibius sp. 7325 TaxID=3131994 RepID=UPI0030EC3B2B